MLNFFNRENIKLFLFIFISIFFIFFTTSNQEILSVFTHNAASSKNYYLSISENFPNVASVINYHHAQRFIIPYLIGFFGKIFDVNILFIYKILTYLEFLLIFFIKFKLIKVLKIDFYTSLIFFGIFIFNPYILRYFTIYPEMLVDLTFILSGYLFVYSILYKKLNIFFLAFFLALVSRQTGLAFFVSLIITNFFFRKNIFINYKNIIFIFFILTTIYFFIFLYLIKCDLKNVPTDAVFGLFKYVFKEINFYDLIIFFILPLLILIPFLLFFFNRKFRILNIFKKADSFFLLLSLLVIIAQPILGGPSWTGKNIIRLILLGYPIIFYLMLAFSYREYNYSTTFMIFSFILLIFWSFHPSFSTINIFRSFYIPPLIK